MSNFGFGDFDYLVERQVTQFNEHVEASVNFHKYLLEVLCDEHRIRDYQSLRKPPVRIRTVQPTRPIRPTRLVGASLLQAGRAGKRIVRKVFPVHRRQYQAETDQSCIIDGEFRVIDSEPDDLDPPEATNTINHNTNPREK